MQKKVSSAPVFRQLTSTGLLAVVVLAGSEIGGLWNSDLAAAALITPLGRAAIALYALMVLIALGAMVAGTWLRDSLNFLKSGKRYLGWLLAAMLIALLVWIYLFSPWQTVLVTPWLQLLVAAGLARLLRLLLASQQDKTFGWPDLVLALAIFLYPRLVQEVRIIYPVSWASRAAILAGFLLLLLLTAVLYGPWEQRLHDRLLELRLRLGKYRFLLAGIFLALPLLYRTMVGAGGYILYPNFRFVVLLTGLFAAAFVMAAPDHLVSIKSLGFALGWLVLVSAVTRALLLVVDNPFSLSWSEGNRLYDYSIVFGQQLYNHQGTIPDPYGTPGRYGLWGVLFLAPGLPIWAHRLWNVVLLTLPSLILAWILTRKFKPSLLRWAAFLWIAALFIVLAPLHPPFMIVAIIVALFAFHPSPYVRAASLVAASLYAGVSRWTWMFAPGAWGALIDLLLYYPQRKGNWLQRLLPAIAMALLGILPGFLLNIKNFLGYSSGELGTAQQPLLWYRLLPNATLGPGIVLLMLVTTGPLLALLIYLLVTRQWMLDAWQQLAVWGALLGFLGAGLVISTKIGGGGDLHNLDMYIATLALVVALLLFAQTRLPDLGRWPAWALALLGFLFIFPLYQFTPFYSGAASSQWLNIPDKDETRAALANIRSAVDQYSAQGEVLFMDQRQLLTFGYIKPIPFVYEYEKKYMMDQAMASDAAYFLPYYQDLAARRFSLIVTEPLRVTVKGQSGVFSEENDAWVTWVSAPTLCFYEPIMTDKVAGVQLLVPRAAPRRCDKFLQQVQP